MSDKPKRQLTPEQNHILKEQGTERPFSGKYWNCKEQGTYHCAACDNPLFSSETKYDSGSGWPSFYAPISPDSVEEHVDTSHGMRRVEICCGNCHGHLGHVFPDGPNPTGLRYCINSAALILKPSFKN